MKNPVRVLGLASSLLAFKLQSKQTPEDEAVLIAPLLAALRDGDIESIAKAADMIANPGSPETVKELPKLMAHFIHGNPGLYGVESLSKADILKILRVEFPMLQSLIPDSKRGLTNWWKEVAAIGLDQSRGYESPALRKHLRDKGTR